MKAEIEHDYADLDTANFVKAIEIHISEQGVCVYVDFPVNEDTRSSDLSFRASVPWERLIEESLTDLVSDCRGGRDNAIQLDELTEACDEWIATMTKFIERLRKLPLVTAD